MTTKTFSPRITSFLVSIGYASFQPVNDTFAGCLRYATELRANGYHNVEIKARMSFIGDMDIDGAFLYDGSIWGERDGYRFPVLVGGYEYNGGPL